MSKKKFKERKNNQHQHQAKSLRKALLAFFHEQAGKSFHFKQIVREVGPKNKAENKELFALLDSFEKSGKIRQLADGSYESTEAVQTLEGIVDHVNPRFAYVNTGGESDVYVRTQDLATALHGDKVRISIVSERKGQKAEGKVEEIVKRNRTRFVGRLELSPNRFAFVVPDFKKIYQDFFIYQDNVGKAKHNDKVLFEVTKWQRGRQRVAGIAPIGASIKRKIERLAAVDASAERPPERLFAHACASGGGSPILYTALISCVTLSRATLNQRRHP